MIQFLTLGDDKNMNLLDRLKNWTKNTNTQENNMSPLYREQLKGIEKLKSDYEQLSKQAIKDPILEEATRFYGDNFDAKERMIGISFVRIKILPTIVPMVKDAISHVILNENISIESLKEDHNISKIFFYKTADGKTLLKKAQGILFKDEYPYPYRDIHHHFSEEQMENLTKDLIKRLVYAERKFLLEVSINSGKQLAILENLTQKFDSKTTIKNGFLCTYDIEEELLLDGKEEKIKIQSKKGCIYKEEMLLYILQTKYKIMLESGQYDANRTEIKYIEEEIARLYKKHCLRIGKADKDYLEALKARISEEKAKGYSTIVPTLQEEKDKVTKRIEKRKNLWEKTIKPRITNSNSLPKRKFTTVPGIECPKSKRTQLEAKYCFNGYIQEKRLIQTLKLPSKNRLYAYAKNEETFAFSRLGEAMAMEEPTQGRN